MSSQPSIAAMVASVVLAKVRPVSVKNCAVAFALGRQRRRSSRR